MKALAPLALTACLLAGATARSEDVPPERLLPAGTQVYLRWDGAAAHREAYRQLPIGKLLEGELAPLLKSLLDLFPDGLRSGLTNAKLLDGEPPEKLAKVHADVAAAGKLLDVVADHGVVVGLETGGLPSLWQMAMGGVQSALGQKTERNPLIPRVQGFVVLPGAAKEAAPVLSMLRLYAASQNQEIREERLAGRTVLHVAEGEVHVLAWVEGPHVIAVIGTELPAAVLARIDAPGPKLDSSPLFRRVRDFDKFPTDARAFIDTRALAEMARRALGLVSMPAARKLDALGLDGLHAVVYYSGFEGPVRRELVEADLPGPRKGLGTLFSGVPLAWDRLPPMPPDVSRWSAHRLDPTTAYDLALQLYELADKADSYADPLGAGSFPPPVAPSGPAKPPEPVAATPNETPAQRLDRLAGIAVKSELIEQLGDLVVTYHSPAEGAISFGQVLAVSVKDGEKVLQALDQIVQTQAGSNVRLKRRPFRDGEIREIYVRKQGFFFVPSYTVYKGWLVVSLYPQPLQGFLQRAAGDAPAWQPDATVKAHLAAMPRNATSWAMSDSRPAVTQVLTFAPIIIEAAQSFGERGTFEIGTLPSASVLNRHLTPNVTVQTDDGRTLRWESRGSVLLPGDYLGIDPLTLFLSASILN
jgi:hypothetical protein